jgi:uncharacterized protein
MGARRVSAVEARRFLRRAHGFDAALPDIASALARHGYIQIDPLNVCGRMHDHILRNRVAGYREGDLMRHLHGEEGGAATAPEARTAFEHHLPSSDNLVAFPLEAWAHLHVAMQDRTRRSSRWLGGLTPRERELSKRIVAELESRGPLGPEAFEDGRRGTRVWGSATLAKATLQKLFFHGRVLIAARKANRRIYDLPGRVLPAAVVAGARHASHDIDRWMALLRLRQHRLVALKRAEFALVADLVEAVQVDGCPTLYCLRTDISLFEESGAISDETDPHLLAPLDPMIYDRRVTRLLWGFDYAWEVYTPASKRKRGYYALPILAGTELVGDVDLKADRIKGRLGIVSRRVRRGHATARAVGGLARFLGLKAG